MLVLHLSLTFFTMKYFWILLLTLIGILTMSCFPEDNLMGNKWMFHALENDSPDVATVYADDACRIHLTFDNNGGFSGFSGWNSYRGKFTNTADAELSMQRPSATKRAGDRKCKIGEQLFGIFPQVVKYTAVGDSLKLFTNNGQTLVYYCETEK